MIHKEKQETFLQYLIVKWQDKKYSIIILIHFATLYVVQKKNDNN